MAHCGSVFKSVCQDILEPRGVKVGGYKDEIFESLDEEEREEICCQICFMVAKDAHTCTNKHLFCGSCIYAWSMTSEGNTDRCPACRVRGAYCSDPILSSRISNMAAKCASCKWKGQLEDYRGHSHGLEDVGLDPKQADLPSIWSNDGEAVFPDLCSSEKFEETVESSRRRHQRRYLDTQLELIEGQARLAFLLDVFEEDLQRHRENLNSLVSIQRRYNAEQYSEVIRLESELGHITANLLRLIESANNDVDAITNRLRPHNPNTGNRMNEAMHRTQARLRDHTRTVDLQSSLTAVEEPRVPVRRARFFRPSAQQAGAPTNPPSNSVQTIATPRLHVLPESISQATTTSTLETDRSSSQTIPGGSIQPTPPDRHTTDMIDAPAERTNQRLLSRRATDQSNTLSTSAHNTQGQGQSSSGQQRPLDPSPPTGTRSTIANPFTITWPPGATGSGTDVSSSTRVSRQQLRHNALERSRRESDT